MAGFSDSWIHANVCMTFRIIELEGEKSSNAPCVLQERKLGARKSK